MSRVLVLLIAGQLLALPQPDPQSMYGELKWRMIGPHRGGRTVAVVGIPSRPNVFLAGVNNGGVWKTTDYGRMWTPVFDGQPTGSIGAIAIAPSNPDIIYVGSGEGLQRPDLSTGDGIYRSPDGGTTWERGGLRNGAQIPQIVVDPRNPNRLWVAVLGRPYGPNEERGVFRSTDGGQTFEKVLYRDVNTGGVDIAMDPTNPDTLYAVLWAARQFPWEGGADGPGSGLFKSTDGGDTWRPLTRGLPSFDPDRLGRIGIGIAPSQPSRIYLTVDSPTRGGIYRSDDSGESWERINADTRVWGRASDFAEIKVHPRNPDIVFSGNIVAWKSVDGGRTFTAFRGAPGGDDYHRLWINPENPDIIIAAADQGVIITVNGGETWSSWYNQPTAQFYHVSTDSSFPYRVCGGQQESGPACVRSRGDHGQITFREWSPVGAEEYGYVAPDPLNPDIVYGGKVTQFDRRTGQTQNVSPRPLRSPDYRVVRTQPVMFHPADPRMLLFASNVLWKTLDGGRNWTAISPDLTRERYEMPGSMGIFAAFDPEQGRHRGVIYAIAPSPKDVNIIWAGTDDGLIHITRDGGKTWSNVTPPDLQPWSKISILDASHFDVNVAYAAVNTFRIDDHRPHIYRTRDGGRTWVRITGGIPQDEGIVNVVREDSVKPGLLFAGTERQVWVSFNDGLSWEPLRNNMPATSVRDLVIKDDDLVAGTHGRSFWILDDITPLRQHEELFASAGVYLFKPQRAWRVRWNTNTDTPLPQEEPAGQNPPDGAILHYFVQYNTARPVVIEILDAAGATVRRYSSEDPEEPPVPGRNIPDYWIRPQQRLVRTPGLHRFVWDLRYAPPAVLNHTYPIAAVYRNTPRSPQGAWVLPGNYTVRLTVDEHTLTQPLTVRMDPRVQTPVADLTLQHRLSLRLMDGLKRNVEALTDVRQRITSGNGPAPQLVELLNGSGDNLTRINGELAQLFGIVQAADRAPTTATSAAVTDRLKALDDLLARWTRLRP